MVLLTSWLLALQEPAVVNVGRAAVVYWPGDAALATALAEQADAPGHWPGIPDSLVTSVRILVARSDRAFDSLTAGRLPPWGAGAAFPGMRTIVVQAGGDPFQVLRHEMAHVALHAATKFVPLWFDEGYAARASGEWGRLGALRLNWAVASGRVPSLRRLVGELRSSAARAEAAYALATSAVLLLERMGGERGLEPLLATLRDTADFDRALRATYQVSLVQFERRWHEDLRVRFGWVTLLGSFGALWALVLAVVGTVWLARRRRLAARRSALDNGWVVPVNGEEPTA